jgi:hypothetical protein
VFDENCVQNFNRNLKGEELWDLDAHERIILKCIFKTHGARGWIEFTWFRIEVSGGPVS